MRTFRRAPCFSLAGIETALRTWFGSGQDVSLDAVATKYTDIAHWSPLTQKERLARSGGVEYAQPALCVRRMHVVDRDLPELQFVIGSVASRLACPVFPDGEAPHREAQLQQALAFELGAAGPGRTSLVGSLAPFADAMRAGLALWIDAVASQGIVRSWSIEPVDLDIVLLELHGDDDRFWRIPIRLHRIGLHGIDLIIEQLNREIGAPTASNRQRQ